MGETSASVIRALAAGRPMIVSDVGWFSELPDSVAAKVPVGPHEVETLAAYLDALASDAGLRARMGRAAAQYARREYDLNRVAELYLGGARGGSRRLGGARRDSPRPRRRGGRGGLRRIGRGRGCGRRSGARVLDHDNGCSPHVSPVELVERRDALARARPAAGTRA